METGTIIKSSNFHSSPYWVVKCDNPNLKGNRQGELPIDPVTEPSEFVFLAGRCISAIPLRGRKVKFELVEIGNVENYKWYARIK